MSGKDIIEKIFYPLIVIVLFALGLIAKAWWLIWGYRLKINLKSDDIQVCSGPDGLGILCLKFSAIITNNHKKPVSTRLAFATGHCVSRDSHSTSSISYPLVWSETMSTGGIDIISHKSFELHLFKEGSDMSSMAYGEVCEIEYKDLPLPKYFSEGGTLYLKIFVEAGDPEDEFGVNYAKSKPQLVVIEWDGCVIDKAVDLKEHMYLQRQ